MIIPRYANIGWDCGAIRRYHTEQECEMIFYGKTKRSKNQRHAYPGTYEQVYKTLVTVGSSKNYFVFVIPIAEELDMKKAAKSVGEKSVEMIHVKDINAITGYIRGGCTAIGMKKQYVTRIDESAKTQEQIYVSGGRIGSQIQLKPDDLAKAAKAEFADIIRHEN